MGPAAFVVAVLALLPLAGAGAAGEGEAAAAKPAATPAQTQAAPAAVDWLERAARIYQEEIVARLAVPRQPAANETVAGDSDDRAPPGGIAGALRQSVAAALSYISFWVQQANAVLGGPLTELAYGVVGTPAERAAREADQFVEARRQADEHWKRAVARADAAAAARRVAGPGDSTGETPAEAELRRAEARKAELAKIKEDLDRRISEGLKKLEEFQKQERERQKIGLLTPPAGPDAAERAASDAEKTRVAAEEERARAEAEAAQKAEEAGRAEQARQRMVAEQARQQKVAEEATKQKAAEQAQQQAAEKGQREAAAKAEQARLAQDEARKLAEAELAARKAEEARRWEAQAAEEKRQADTKAEAARVAKDAARVAEQARLADEQRVRAEREATEQQYKQAAEAEQTRQAAEDARRRADAKAAEQRVTEAREAQAKQRWAEARAVPDKRQAVEPGAAKRTEPQPADPKVAAAQSAAPQAAENPDEAVRRRGGDLQASTGKEEAARPVQVADNAAPNVRHRRTAAKKADVQSVSRKKKLASSRSPRRDVAGRCIRKKTARAGGRRIHVVERGETLWTISRRYMKKGGRYDDIRSANGRKIRDPDRIYPCQRLLLPARA
ncbi:LysM peptidoglycan-binding domain-containing protein [Hyphomicrobium sp.]|uniref:LysM peptidoglycan-binding domain-containing protein n=1 Tax=Hyphomicrobium sp. TaxID=82 RepID=UPI003F722D97